MPKIFLSYRRDDNPFAVDWIDHGLSEQFGRESIVRDIDTFPLGRDFRVVIEREVNTCEILLAIIGDRWLDMRYSEGEKSGQRRIDDPEDFVRLEIEAALQRDIPVIPVLVDRALMPREAEVPESLRELVYRGAVEVRAGRDRQTHLNRLIAGIIRDVEHQSTKSDKELFNESISILSSTFTNSIGMELILIPAGEFTMGSSDSDPEALTDEGPAHQVTISQSFYLGKYPVTQAQWRAVIGHSPGRLKTVWESVMGLDQSNPNHPAVNVSWDDVQAFIRKLNEREGVSDYRLPTEAEWEYACRAGSSTIYHFGDTKTRMSEFVWFRENAGNTTHPVGQKKPNAWGLYDMHGNVWEWCQDWYDKTCYSNRNSPSTDPHGPSIGEFHVIRGGSFRSSALDARSAARSYAHPGARFGARGFRCLSSGLSQ